MLVISAFKLASLLVLTNASCVGYRPLIVQMTISKSNLRLPPTSTAKDAQIQYVLASLFVRGLSLSVLWYSFHQGTHS